MKSRSRWFTFILLNIIVSATVTGAVLYYYDHYYKSTPTPILIATSPSPTSVQQGVVSDDVQLEIVSVIGTGVAETEVVVIQNMGTDSVLLTNWILRNGEGTFYTFPQVSLFKDGTVQVHTSAGANTPVDLYWGRTQSTWHSGDTAALFDTQGNLRATYIVP